MLKLVQIIAQARQIAKRISDQSAEVAANSSFLSWFSMGFSDPNYTFNGAEADDMGECVKKTHEFLDKALDFLCQIFRVSLQNCNILYVLLGMGDMAVGWLDGLYGSSFSCYNF